LGQLGRDPAVDRVRDDLLSQPADGRADRRKNQQIAAAGPQDRIGSAPRQSASRKRNHKCQGTENAGVGASHKCVPRLPLNFM
jgi:hypothetical protein